MVELFNVVVKGNLIKKSSWEKYVDSLKVKEQKISKKDAANLIKEQLVLAVKRRIPKKRFGILFSGGVDSTLIALICKKLKADFICYSVGAKNSPDLEWSRRIAKKLRLKHKSKMLAEEEFEAVIRKVIKIIKEPDVVKIGVGSVLYAAAELAKKDKISILFSGLGSEEIFAGYERHVVASDINKECWNGLKKMWGRDLIRDCKISAALKLDVRTPFLDNGLILSAMRIPGEYKLNKGVKKLILREAALLLGLEKEFAFRKKTAAQYGSKFNDMLDRIAKKHGFKFKKDYLASLL